MSFPRFLLIPITAVALVSASCGTIPPTTSGNPSGAASSPSTEPTAASVTPNPAGTISCDYTVTGDAAKPVDLPPISAVPNTGTVTYAVKFGNGTVKITMDRSKAPCTINSFVSLAKQGFYDNTDCHRLGDSGAFFLQCGDPQADGMGGPGYQFPDELNGSEEYKGGVVAMANSGPDTNGSQFFMVWDSSPFPPNYTIFGTMDKAGRDVIASIASQGQDGSGGDGTGKPNAPATIASVKPV